jgi:hypothetical protein
MNRDSNHQKTAGEALVDSIIADLAEQHLAPDARETELLPRASAAADRIAELERLVAEQGSTFTDKYGTVRPSPLLAEIRSTTLVLARCPGRYPDECRACGEESSEAACRAEELGRSHRSRQPERGVMASNPDPRAVFGREGAEREAAAASNLRTQPRQQRCVLDVDALKPMSR